MPVAALLTYFDVLGRMTLPSLLTVLMRQSNALITKVLNVTTYLVAIPWALSRALPVFFALAFGGEFVQHVVNFVTKYQWVADGLTLAGRMLPGLGFAILLRYLPVKRNLHYLAMGFGFDSYVGLFFTHM